MKYKKKTNLDKEVRNTGIALIVLGVVHFIFSGFLDSTWGFVLITVGIISLFYRSKKMLLTFGILLILVGILNLIYGFIDSLEGISAGWAIFGVFQIIWGIQEINIFRRTKENPKYNIKEKKKKDFIWYGLRTGFYVMIGFWLLNVTLFLSVDEESTAYGVFVLFWVISIIFTFVLSIINLRKYKQKAFAIISLIFASFIILITIVGLLYPEEGDSSQDLTVQEIIGYVDSFCSISCNGLENVQTYDYQYDEELDEMVCYCLDSNYEVILEKIVTYPSEAQPIEEHEEPQEEYICDYNAYNCDAFSSHREAQRVYELCGGLSNDIHYLDGDDDGLACESLP